MLAALGILAYVLMSSIYTVSEVEQMIITQFGKPVGEPVTSAGLKVKVPFIQEVNPIDKRVLEWDGSHQGQALHLGRFICPLADY
jgi:membrane protease subunit HflC